MKKFLKRYLFIRKGNELNIKRMKLTLLFSFFILTGTWANSLSQTTKLSLNLENATVYELITTIEKQTDFYFLYQDDVFKKGQRVTIKADNESLESILKKFEKQALVSTMITNYQIILKKNIHKTEALKQQQKTITGIVTDKDGDPIPYVSVIVKGTTIGTVTGSDGKFSLEIPEDARTLQFSFIGMKTVDMPVDGKTVFNVVLESESVGLEEVVAIGYGTQKKKDLTGSISTIKSDKLIDNSPVDVLDGMQGKIAGVRISSGSGEPGAGVDITIRGYNSISAGTSPLFVVDGMPYDVNSNEMASSSIGNGNSSNPLSTINPADIESISILKDASSTAIYGSRGANGVIIITTKKGKLGRSLINFSTSVGFSETSKKLDVLSGNEFIEYRRVVDPEGFMFYSNGDINFPIDPYALKQHNWQDEVLKTALQQNYDLSMSGKTDKTSYSVSLGYLNNEAIVAYNDQQRYSMRMKVDHQKSEKLLVGLRSNATYSEINGAAHSGGGNGLFNGVVQNLVISTPVELYNPTFDPSDNYISPSSMLDDSYKKMATLNTSTNAFMNYTIIDGLSLNLTGGYSFSSSKGSEFYGKETVWGVGDKGYSNLSESRAYTLNGSAQLHYSKYFNEIHKLSAMLAAETNVYNYEWFGVTKINFLDESTGVFDISKGSTAKSSSSFRDNSKRVSFFGRVNYTFKDKHILTGTMRADGSDKFGSGNRYGFFPSGAYSWVLMNEGFMQNQSVLSNAKFRLSYGVAGNDRIPSHRYLARLENTYYNGQLGMAPNSQANELLKWETTYQSNIGLDLGFLKDAIILTVDVYNKQTHDMLIPTPTPSRTGYSQQWQNIGRVDNKGIELQLSTRNINKKDFKWTTNFNISHNENTVVDLGLVDFIPVYMQGGWIQDIGRVQIGHALGEAYGYVFDGIYQLSDFTWQEGSNPSIPHDDRDYVLNDNVISVAGMNVRPGSHKFKDLDGDGVITLDEDRQSISSSQPLFFGGIGNTFTYKNFELNVFLEGSYGNEIFNESKFRLEGGIINSFMNVSKDFYYNHWTLDNPSETYGDYADFNPSSFVSSSYYVEDASYIRLKSVSLGYNLSPKLIHNLKLYKARVFVTGNNLYTWTNYSGYDPEVNSGNSLLSGVDRISYPRARTILFGLNITF